MLILILILFCFGAESRFGGENKYLTQYRRGVSHTVPVLDLTIEDMRKVFEINVFSCIRLVQVLAPLLIEAKGKIANIGSVAAIIPYVFGGMCLFFFAYPLEMLVG